MYHWSGLLFVRLLPSTKDELAKLHTGNFSGSRVGGFIFLFVTITSVFAAIVICAINIITGGVS